MNCLRNKFAILTCLCIFTGQIAIAQSNGTNSSYSRYGLGIPADPSQSFNRSMGGVAQGLRASYRINQQNPASYSAIDSLTFLFDVGISGHRTIMVQGDTRKNVNNTSFDYVNAAFRIRQNLGMSIGFRPYTHIGYSFSKEEYIGKDNTMNENLTQTLTFKSTDSNNMISGGGLHQAYVGLGWMPFNGFSIGANAGLLWGNINHKITQTYTQNGTTTTTDNNISKFYTSSIFTWKGDIGIQYQTLLNSTNRLTFGATVGLGHRIGSEASYISSTTNGSADTLSVNNAYQLPMTYSIGAAWEHAEQWTVAADCAFEQWGDCTIPQMNEKTKTYEATTGAYKNRLRFNVGAEYVPARYDRRFSQRINYRFGAYYSTPYMKVNGVDGPKEYGLTAGIGLPITNFWTNSSYLNLYSPSYVHFGVQWTHRAPSSSTLISEHIFQINIGLTFNERWFQKWKFK